MHYHALKWTGPSWKDGDTPAFVDDWLKPGGQQRLSATFTTPQDAADWMMAQWAKAAEKSLNPVPEWVGAGRAERVLDAIEGGTWPAWSHWIKGPQIIKWVVVGTDERCH